MKQLATGVRMYVQDYDERYPYDSYGPGINYTTPSGDVRTNSYMLWMFMVYPYVKNTQLFNCPSVGQTFTGAYTSNMRYGWNGGLNNKADAQITYPAECITVAETTYGPGNTGNPYRIYYNATTDTFDLTNGSPLDPRHNEGLNAAFCDGHGKWVKTDSIATNDRAWTGM